MRCSDLIGRAQQFCFQNSFAYVAPPTSFSCLSIRAASTINAVKTPIRFQIFDFCRRLAASVFEVQNYFANFDCLGNSNLAATNRQLDGAKNVGKQSRLSPNRSRHQEFFLFANHLSRTRE